MKKTLLGLLAAVALAVPHARAESSGFLSGAHLGVSGGTLGVGPEVGMRFAGDRLGVRLGANFLDFGHDFRSGGVRYKGEASLENYSATLDWHPWGNGFRLSAGLKINESDVSVRGTPEGSVRAGGRTYAAADIGTLDGKVSWNPVNPYLGIGYTGRIWGGLGLSIDAGASYIGQGKVSLGASGPVGQSALARDYIESQRAEVRDAVSDYRFYPVVQATVFWRF